jgi:predicted RNA binding protein YcfA (HicA-like mRNA interferase family)
MNSKELISKLEKDGWTLRGSKGSHHIFINPIKTGHISVPTLKKIRYWIGSEITKTTRIEVRSLR